MQHVDILLINYLIRAWPRYVLYWVLLELNSLSLAVIYRVASFYANPCAAFLLIMLTVRQTDRDEIIISIFLWFELNWISVIWKLPLSIYGNHRTHYTDRKLPSSIYGNHSTHYIRRKRQQNHLDIGTVGSLYWRIHVHTELGITRR